MLVFSPAPNAPPILKPKCINGLPARYTYFCCHERNIGPALDKVNTRHYIDTIHILELVFVVVLTPPVFSLNPLVGGEGVDR